MTEDCPRMTISKVVRVMTSDPRMSEDDNFYGKIVGVETAEGNISP